MFNIVFYLHIHFPFHMLFQRISPNLRSRVTLCNVPYLVVVSCWTPTQPPIWQTAPCLRLLIQYNHSYLSFLAQDRVKRTFCTRCPKCSCHIRLSTKNCRFNGWYQVVLLESLQWQIHGMGCVHFQFLCVRHYFGFITKFNVLCIMLFNGKTVRNDSKQLDIFHSNKITKNLL